MIWAYPINKEGRIAGAIHEFSDLDWQRLMRQPATPRRWKVTVNPKKKEYKEVTNPSNVIDEKKETGYRVVEPEKQKSDLKTVAEKGSKKKK